MEEYKPKNREKAKEPRGKSNWCACDRTKVNDGSKCPLCRKRNQKEE